MARANCWPGPPLAVKAVQGCNFLEAVLTLFVGLLLAGQWCGLCGSTRLLTRRRSRDLGHAGRERARDLGGRTRARAENTCSFLAGDEPEGRFALGSGDPAQHHADEVRCSRRDPTPRVFGQWVWRIGASNLVPALRASRVSPMTALHYE